MDSLEQTNELLNNTAMDIIDAAKTLLPDEIINGKMVLNGQEIPVSLYMDKFLIGVVNDKTTPEMIANIIKTKFLDKIIQALPDEVKRERAMKFLETKTDKDRMYSSYKTVGEEFIERCVMYMDDNDLLPVGPNKKTMEEYYQIVLNNISQTYTKEDQIETYKVYMDDILGKELMSSKKVGTEMTVKEYILNVLMPTEEDYIYVTYNDRKVQIDEALLKIREEQLEFINAQVEIPELKEEVVEEVIEEPHDFGNPTNVGEIIYRVEADKSVTVSTDTPFNPNKELNDEETNNILAIHGSVDPKIITSLNQLMDAVNKTSSLHDLDNLEKEKNELANELAGLLTDSYIVEKFRILEELMIKKRNNLIKVDGNKEDYVDAIQGRITSLQEELRDCNDPKKFDIVYGEIISIQREVQAKGIRDYELEAVIERLSNDLLLKRIKADSLMPNQSKDVERLVAEIDDRIKGIEQSIYEMKTNRNEASVAGVSVRVEREYNELVSLITNSYREGKLPKEVYEQYLEVLNKVVELEQEEQRINKLG